MTAIPPNDEERKFWDELIRHEVVVAVDPQVLALELGHGFVNVGCGDADHRDAHTKMVLELLGSPSRDRMHSLSLNGGAIREEMIADTVESLDLKGVDIAVLSIHFPCGKMRAHGMTPFQAMNKMFETKRAIKRERPNARIVCVAFFYDGKDRHLQVIQKERWRRHVTSTHLTAIKLPVPTSAPPTTNIEATT